MEELVERMEAIKMVLFNYAQQGYWNEVRSTPLGVDVNFCLAEAHLIINSTVGYRTRKDCDVSCEALDLEEAIRGLLV